MVKRSYSNMGDTEPDQKEFKIPTEKEHLFQVVDVYDINNNEYEFDLGPDDVCARLEVCGGEEEGRSILNRLSLDINWKGFFATRLFLKAIGEEYKGNKVDIDTNNWIGKQFYATVVHNQAKNGKTYANIEKFNFEKVVEAPIVGKKDDDVAWDD